MFGATAQERTWEETPAADHAPTLAPAPEGLSARRVERWLDLPPGAWQKRRLYALRLKGQAFSALGFVVGDIVVVEPGAREQPGGIVVTRGPNGPSLKRISPTVRAERRMPTVLELPLREKIPASNEHVVGTVIGLLRPTGTGALRPAALPASRTGTRRPSARPMLAGPVAGALAADEPVSLDRLLQTQNLWRKWLAMIRESDRTPPEGLERWKRLDSALAALCDCLSRTHSPGLRAALAVEAEAVVSAIRGEMRG
ncbi:MAG: LexA family protein [Candidatus Binatia bacterium]